MTSWLHEARRLFRAQRLAEAGEICRRVLADDPADADALHLAGVILLSQGDHLAALDILQQAVTARPDAAPFHNNLGVALRAAGRGPEAAACFRRALQLRPRYADALSNLGSVLDTRGAGGSPAEALDCFHAALAIDPAHADAHYNLANLLAAQGRPGEAVEHYRQALAVRPNWSDAANNLGNALLCLDRQDEAIAAYRQAAAANPQSFAAWNNLGLAARRAGETATARQAWQAAAALSPEVPLWRFRARALAPPVFESTDEIEAYRAGLSSLLDEFAAGPPLFSDLEHLPASGAEPPFELLFQGLENRELKQKYSTLFAAALAAARSSGGWPESPRRTAARKHLGFVVTQLHEAIFVRWMAGLLDRLDRREFSITIVCARAGQAHIARALTNAATEYLILPERLTEMVAALRAAQLDLLHYWEIGTDTVNYVLPHFRLAPVQTTACGVQDTSGIATVDAYLSCAALESAAAAGHYTERLILCDAFPYHYPRPVPPARTLGRGHFGFRPDDHLYICLQQLRKLHPDNDELFAGILRADPRGRIVLRDDASSHVGGLLRERFTRHLPDVAERIVFLPYQDQTGYLSLLQLADCVLDPVHFNGTTTTLDALGLGIPIVTLPSDFQRGRFTAGCYDLLGLPDFAVRTTVEYIALALRLATDAPYRQACRQRIIETCDALFENPRSVVVISEFLRTALSTAG